MSLILQIFKTFPNFLIICLLSIYETYVHKHVVSVIGKVKQGGLT